MYVKAATIRAITLDCNASFRNYFVAIARKKIAARILVCLQNLPIEKLPEYSEFQLFFNFSEVIALAAQDMLHTEITTRDGNAIIS